MTVKLINNGIEYNNPYELAKNCEKKVYLDGNNCFDFFVNFLAVCEKELYIVPEGYKKPELTGQNGIYIMTSGSTAEPKVIKKSLKNLILEAKDMVKIFNLDKDLVFVSTTVPAHMFGLTFQVMIPLELGCTVDTDRVQYPEDLKDYDNYVLISTPSFLEKMFKYKEKFKNPPKYIFTAGAKLKDEVFEFLEQQSKVIEIYGSTEAGVVGYRTKSTDNFKFFEKIQYNLTENGVNICSPYACCENLTLTDEIEFVDDGFRVGARCDRMVKIQEKRVSLPEVEAKLKSSNLVEDAYCLKIDDKLCAAVVLSGPGKNIFINQCRLSLISELKKNFHDISPKRWRFLYEIPVDERGKVNVKRIKEIFNTNFSYPFVTKYNVTQDYAEFNVIFPKSSNFFEGHFTGMPILPGVVQLFIAKEFIKDAFHIDFVPEKVKKVKFSSIIKPDTEITITLTKTSRGIEYKFTKDEIIFSCGTFEL